MLSLEVVTRKGRALLEEDLTEVVFRRLEDKFEQGSEIAILRRHAPMLMRNAAGTIRWRDKKDIVHAYDLSSGLVEVLDDRVLVIVDDAGSSSEI